MRHIENRLHVPKLPFFSMVFLMDVSKGIRKDNDDTILGEKDEISSWKAFGIYFNR